MTYPHPAGGSGQPGKIGTQSGAATFRTREDAEKAMQQINESLEREKAKGVDPQAIAERWKEEGEEPYNGIRMTPELRASILKKGFPMFVKGGASVGLAASASPFGRPQEPDQR